MRNHWFGRGTGVAAGIAVAIVISLPALSGAQAPAGRGRGAAPAAPAKPAPPAAPAPRFKDGTINLDAVPGQKGFWNAFNGQLVGKTGNALPTNLEIAEVPFRPWAKALYDYRKIRTIPTRGVSRPADFDSGMRRTGRNSSRIPTTTGSS